MRVVYSHHVLVYCKYSTNDYKDEFDWTPCTCSAWSGRITQESARPQITIVVISVKNAEVSSQNNMKAFQTFYYRENTPISNNNTLRHANPPFGTWSKDGWYSEYKYSCSEGLNFSLHAKPDYIQNTRTHSKVTTKMLCVGIFVGLVLESWSLPVQVRILLQLCWYCSYSVNKCISFVSELLFGPSDKAEDEERLWR